MNKTGYFSFYSLIALLIVKALFMILWIQYSGLQLAPDEAQYWTWSQHLDWGYYSKPPAISWQIWLGTKVLGNTVIGVRIGAVILSFLISVSVYFLALVAGLQPRTAFWAGVLSALSPMGFFASYYATTDIGMVLFWTLCCLVLVSALRHQKTPRYLLLGLLVGVGALYKWPIYLILVIVLLTLVFVPYFRSWMVIPCCCLSLLGLVPSVVWNMERGWPTFRHVWGAMSGDHGVRTSLFHGNFWDFFGAQAALLSPIFFLFLLFSFASLIRHWNKIPLTLKFCGLFSLVILVPYQTAALFQKIQGNWCVFVYPMATVFVTWYLLEFVSWGKKWLPIGVGVSLSLVTIIFTLPLAQVYGIGPPIPLKANRYNECMGWDNIKACLEAVGYDPKTHILVSHRYQMTSLLSFYSPGQKRAYFLNLNGRRLNQFSFWSGMEKGQSGFFVISEEMPFETKAAQKRYQEMLTSYFNGVTYVGWTPLLEIYGEAGKVLLIFSFDDYNGKIPSPANHY